MSTGGLGWFLTIYTSLYYFIRIYKSLKIGQGPSSNEITAEAGSQQLWETISNQVT